MKKFYLIDDDENIRGILTNIIEGENLGIVVGEAEDGMVGSNKWSFFNPDIIVIDYLMPNLDGASAMEEIIDQGFTGKFIMLSQVADPLMKSTAYERGAMFYLTKPINYIEVRNVLETVSKIIDLENSLSLIQNTLTSLTSLSKEVSYLPKTDIIKILEKLEKILSELGVLGETGKKEFKEVVISIYNLHGKKYVLKDIYKEVSSDINARSLEQKIRRLIQKSLQNIAGTGINDSYDPIFCDYNSTLFDFVEVKKEMAFKKGLSEKGGKVSIKRFIEGTLSILELHFEK